YGLRCAPKRAASSSAYATRAQAFRPPSERKPASPSCDLRAPDLLEAWGSVLHPRGPSPAAWARRSTSRASPEKERSPSCASRRRRRRGEWRAPYSHSLPELSPDLPLVG